MSFSPALRRAIVREREVLRNGLYPIYVIATIGRSACRAGLKPLILAYRKELCARGLSHLVERAEGRRV